MTFPSSPLPIKQELLINGVWTDITSKTRASGGVSITRGYSGEQYQLSPGSATFTLDNRDNRFSTRNPSSPYYRQLGRNTQYRCSVDTGIVSARFPDNASSSNSLVYDGSTIWTADKAVLDISTDLDVSIDIEPEDWHGRRGSILASKWLLSGNNRSWVFMLNPDGHLVFLWTTDGTLSTVNVATCPTPLSPTGRFAVRAILDVDDGAGGWTCAFYTTTSMAGTYTLFDYVTGGGVTSVYAGTARVEIGTANLAAGWRQTFTTIGLGDGDPFVGKVYAFRIRNGIGGPIVANMNALAQPAGSTTWSDGLSTPNTWTVAGSIYLSSQDFRFWGEIPSMPRRADTSVTDLTVPVRAADIIQRLNSGSRTKPLRSPVFRNLQRYAWDGYWPMEDDFGASRITAQNGLPGYKASADFSTSPSDFSGSAGALIFTDDGGYASGTCTASSGTPALVTMFCYFKFDTLPASAAGPFIDWYFGGGGNTYRATFTCGNSSFLLDITKQDGTSLVSQNIVFGPGILPTQWLAMRLKLTQSAGTVTWRWDWYPVGTDPDNPTLYFVTGTYAGTVGTPRSWISWAFAGKFGLQLAHVAMGKVDVGWDTYHATDAYVTETWERRFRRLAGEENISVWVQATISRDGTNEMTHTMGPQGLKTVLDLFQECADVAGGILYAPRDKFGLTIRAWEAIANHAAPALDYAAAHLTGTLEPEPDDFLIENDVTVQRANGSKYRAIKTTGSLNTGDPATSADAVGTYDVQYTVNAGNDDDLEMYARRRLLLGTWDEDRYPEIQVNLERSELGTLNSVPPSTADQARALDLARPLSIVNPGAWLSANQVDLLVTGYAETLTGQSWVIKWNGRPYGPWQSGIWQDPVVRQVRNTLWGAASTTLKTGVTSSATSLTFTTSDPFEIWSTTITNVMVDIAGERIRITAMGARTGSGPYDQMATVVRSINGVSKALAAGETVTVVDQGRWA
jgi:hypothetical protein